MIRKKKKRKIREKTEKKEMVTRNKEKKFKNYNRR